MSHVLRNMRRVSAQLTQVVGMYWGETFPLYYVCEHPRSGGTWLGDMLGDYLEVPFPKGSIFPIGCPAVIHGHWTYAPRLRRVYYMYRDGRDVALSLYFYVAKSLAPGADPVDFAYTARRFPYLAKPGADLSDPRPWLPRFIEDWVRTPTSCRQSWPAHMRAWATGRPHVFSVSYEALLADTAGVLSRALEAHTGNVADPTRVAATVQKFSFARQTRRQPGSEDRRSDKRKGVVGDWKLYFTREAARVFDHHCGDVLVRFGYAEDRHWYENLPG